MSPNEQPSISRPDQGAHSQLRQEGYQPPMPPDGYQQPNGMQQPGFPSGPVKQRNVVGLIALVIAIVGFIFAVIPGALILGWVLLPIAFILSIVSLFLRDKTKKLGIAALVISVVGTVVGFVVFFAVVASSFDEAFSDETTVVQPAEEAAPVDEGAAASEAPVPAQEVSAEQGTRESPLPVGSTLSSDDWTVTVNSYNAAGDDVVAAANQFNEAPPAGSHYEIVNYTVTYTGDESDYALMVGVDLVTSGGNVIDSSSSLAVLEDSIGLDELFNGASTTGSVAFLVPDGETALIRVRPGMLADEMFVQP